MNKFTRAAAYLLGIVFVNWLFLHVPMIHVPHVGMLSVGTLVIGVIFILRDVVQRVLGHKVLWLMAAGIAITYAMSPHLALASGVAFAVGEGVEWAFFTFTNRTFRERVLISVIPGVTLDTLVFLLIAGFFTWPNLLVESLMKLVALVWVRWLPDPLQGGHR